MTIAIQQLGVVDYVTTYEAMRLFTKERTVATPDEIWILEHPPVFTLGLAGDPANLHAADGTIPLVQVDRGGQITYHGPGQLVAYLLLDLRRYGLHVKELVHRIEQAVMDTLAEYGLPVAREAGAPGIYIAPSFQGQPEWRGAKIAALGLKVSRHCTYHGLALNVNMDLAAFQQIHPCGYAGLRTVDMRTLGIEDNMAAVSQRLVAQLQQQLSPIA
jgi:lipoyl(octanoyl) transferase